ncbi:MAG: flavodoxin family protein [bacterium]
MRVLVVYDSQTGNTEKMAEAIGEGAREAGGEVVVAKVDIIPIHHFYPPHVLFIGSPCYFGNVSWKIKRLFDQGLNLVGEFKDKLAGYFASAGSRKDGEYTLYFLERFLKIHQMRVLPGILSVGPPTDDILEQCRQYGLRVREFEI